MSQQILSTKTHRAGSFSWIFRTPFSGSCCWKRNQSLETLLSNYYLMHLGHIYDKLILLKKNIANKNWYIFSVFLSMSSCKSGHCAAHTFQGNPLLGVIMGSVLTSITCARPFLSSSARETTTQKFIYLIYEDDHEINAVTWRYWARLCLPLPVLGPQEQ